MSTENTNIQQLDIVGGSPQGFPFFSRDINLNSCVYGDGTFSFHTVDEFSVNSSTQRTITSSDISLENSYGGSPINVSGSDFTPLASEGLYLIIIKLGVEFSGVLPTGVCNVAITDGTTRYSEHSFFPSSFEQNFTLVCNLYLTTSTPFQFLIDNQSTGVVDVLESTKIFITRLN